MPQFGQLAVESIELIPHMVVIPADAHIPDMCDAIGTGRPEEFVVVAKVGGNHYAIDKIDVLYACRKTGAKTVPCVILEYGTFVDALRAHIMAPSRFPINPVRYIMAVDVVQKELGSDAIPGLDAEYVRIGGLTLAPGVRERMMAYIDKLGDRIRHMPSFVYVFVAISKIDLGEQVDAVKRTIRLCERMGTMNSTYTFPDWNNMANLLQHHAKRKDPSLAEKTEDGRGGYPLNETTVEYDKGVAGYFHDPDTNNIDFRCECETEYVVDTKKMRIRKREEGKDMVVLSGEYGEEVYHIRQDIAYYLGLNHKSNIYYYPLDENEYGNFAILGRLRVTKEKMEQVRRLLSPGGLGAAAGGPGRAP